MYTIYVLVTSMSHNYKCMNVIVQSARCDKTSCHIRLTVLTPYTVRQSCTDTFNQVETQHLHHHLIDRNAEVQRVVFCTHATSVLWGVHKNKITDQLFEIKAFGSYFLYFNLNLYFVSVQQCNIQNVIYEVIKLTI